MSTFIGSKIKVISSLNKYLVGLQGTIVDETKNILSIKTKKGVKSVIKHICVFKINNALVEGKKIIGTPSSRIKRLRANKAWQHNAFEKRRLE